MERYKVQTAAETEEIAMLSLPKSGIGETTHENATLILLNASEGGEW